MRAKAHIDHTKKADLKFLNSNNSSSNSNNSSNSKPSRRRTIRYFNSFIKIIWWTIIINLRAWVRIICKIRPCTLWTRRQRTKTNVYSIHNKTLILRAISVKCKQIWAKMDFAWRSKRLRIVNRITRLRVDKQLLTIWYLSHGKLTSFRKQLWTQS